MQPCGDAVLRTGTVNQPPHLLMEGWVQTAPSKAARINCLLEENATSRCTAPGSSAQDAVRDPHPGIRVLCMDQDPLSLGWCRFCHSLRCSCRPALEAGYLSKCAYRLCVKNLLPLALFSGRTAGNSFVCQQPRWSSAAAGRAGRGCLAEPCAGSSMRAGSCHVSLGGWGFLTWCQSGCVPVCAKHVSLRHPRYPSAYFMFVSLRNQCVSWSQISYSRHSSAEGRCRAVVWGQKKTFSDYFETAVTSFWEIQPCRS